MKKVARIIWVSCLFLLLIVILLMVMDYKINYQYQVENCLYFYECNGNLCASNVMDKERLLFSKYECGEDVCPTYSKDISDEYVLLTKGSQSILYQYKVGKVISDMYDDYVLIDGSYFIVKKGDLYGIISIDGSEVVKPQFDEIGYYNGNSLSGYNMDSILVKKKDLYGLLSYRTGKIVEEVKYSSDEIDKLFDILMSN